MSPGVETVCEKIGACPLKLDDKGQRLGLCGVDPELLQGVLTNKEGVSAWPTQCFTEQTGWRVVRTEDGAFVLAPNTTPGILKSEGGGGEAAELIRNAERTGSALKIDKYHQLAPSAVEDIETKGSVFTIVGNDGISRTLVQVPGEVDGVAGRWEWIIDPSGSVPHQFS